jgi:CRISPR/Cas system-associated exonuclease Cas4 (RecB family)
MNYVYGAVPAFRSLALVLGSALHSAVEWYFEQRILGATPEIADAEAILSADLQAETEGKPVRWKDYTPESLEDEGRRLLRTYLKAKADLPVVSVERSFTVDLVDPSTGEYVGRQLKGYFDLVLKGGRVIELKTSSRGWQEFDLIRHLQIGAYAFAWNSLNGGPSQIEVQVIVKLKREPRVETYTIERGEEQTRWWLAAAREIERAIAAGNFPPSPSALCHECEYEAACVAFTGDDDASPGFDTIPSPPPSECALAFTI